MLSIDRRENSGLKQITVGIFVEIWKLFPIRSCFSFKSGTLRKRRMNPGLMLDVILAAS